MGQEDREPGQADGGNDEQMPFPGSAQGVRVEQTGIALVHEGEYISPAPGSEAALSPASAGTDAGQVVNYYFPVEVEVVGSPQGHHLERIVAHVFDQLDTALRSVR